MNYAKALAMCGATLIAATAIMTTATPVHARPLRTVTVVARPAEAYTRHVSYADLNLASTPAVAVLRSRVSYAVRDVCRESIANAFQLTMQQCSSDSWNGARPQVARAVRRAQEIAATGSSSIAAAAITIGMAD
jgi:UrcA family protein